MTARRAQSTFGPNRASLEEMIAANPVLELEGNAAIVQFARTLADQVDGAADGLSSRLAAAYLSALKDLQRAVGTRATPQSRSTLMALREENGKSASRSWRSA